MTRKDGREEGSKKDRERERKVSWMVESEDHVERRTTVEKKGC